MIFCFLFFRFVGRSFVKGHGRPSDIIPKLNELAGFSPDEEIELYEVCFFILCILLSTELVFYVLS